ncbi:4-hydroxy-3-methylbut-2-enyl diphosphate reductase [Coraliomargarita sp. SDUM461003]|uniref:4-hydroxy-3-methylbut-2-enyl diphosphate reductase n=1 Tax=Thalassobacterium maritimum TaxID=3041265 RepID=A0ABU1AY72_9BACT|nr:4-hydroxy-3-methylbut-2-enyl diphosphate reductase [Coraliomargarita sp. SDUM461003]MDQ8209031.1 4-hydroxy-3-methylbut-2-enyl diphosphate reductase [Coraliomargarita sp. SDUM461003]
MMDPIRLLFNSSNHLLVTSSDDGSYTLAQVEPEGRNWHVLSELQSAKGRQSILCALVSEECDVTGEWHTIDRLKDLTLSGDLRQVLQAIDEQLYRIPYLGMGENEYIYRFRTTKERNRSVYIDGQSEALYQSALCLAIKEARRTKEKSSGEPAVLDFGAVSYVIPSHFGFCLGVQNAIERAYETVAQHPNRRVFMLSELIHNPFVNEDLLARGLRYLQTDKGLPLRADGSIATSADDPTTLWNQLTEEDIVIIPAFGATNEDKARLIRRGLSIRENDATCMLVEKVWKAARRYAQEGYTVLIHGKSEHEETKATFSNSSSHGPALMLRNMEHARRLAEVIQAETSEKKALFEASFAGLYSKGFDPLKDLERIAVVNQTTLLRNETLTIIEYLRDVIACKYGESEVAEHLWSKGKGDTLCYATQVNQDALHKAVEQSIDAALVVGGKNSSNTYQLYRVCSERFGEAAHYIQSEDNLRSLDSVRHYIFPYNLTAAPATVEEDRPLFKQVVDKPRILLTGGASCPDGIIQQVIHRINSFFPSDQIRPVQEILAAFRSDT